MTKPWNQAAWRQNTYRPRKVMGTVGDRLHVAAHQSEMLEITCRNCGFHLCSCAAKASAPTFRQRCDLDPSDEEVAELNRPTSADEECPTCEGVGDFGAACGRGGAPCGTCGGLGRVPKLLSLAEAAEVCRAGKTVRCVEDRDETFIGDKFRFYEPCGFQVESLGRKSWTAALDFPCWPGDMRFEVVE